MRVSVAGWPGIGAVTRVECHCPSCAAGITAAIDRYPGLQYPAVFPRVGARPQHFPATQVIDDETANVERHATELAIGATE
jgi:hypothetical protein